MRHNNLDEDEIQQPVKQGMLTFLELSLAQETTPIACLVWFLSAP